MDDMNKYAIGQIVICTNPVPKRGLIFRIPYKIKAVTSIANPADSGAFDVVWTVEDLVTGDKIHTVDRFMSIAEYYTMLLAESIAEADTVDTKTMADGLYDPVTAPQHYASYGIQPIDFAKANFTKEEFRGAMKLNILKYTMRFHMKNGVEDLNKANQYMEWLIESESK